MRKMKKKIVSLTVAVVVAVALAAGILAPVIIEKPKCEDTTKWMMEAVSETCIDSMKKYRKDGQKYLYNDTVYNDWKGYMKLYSGNKYGTQYYPEHGKRDYEIYKLGGFKDLGSTYAETKEEIFYRAINNCYEKKWVAKFVEDGLLLEHTALLKKAGRLSSSYEYKGSKRVKPKIYRWCGESVTKKTSSKDFTLNIGTTSYGKKSFKSSNSKVATVNSKGKVHIVGAGTTTITLNIKAKAPYKAGKKTVKIIVKPAAPKNVTIETLDNKVKLNWDKVNGATSYKIYKNDDSKTFLLATVKETSYTDEETFEGKSQKYYIKACAKINGKGYTSDASEKVSVTIPIEEKNIEEGKDIITED